MVKLYFSLFNEIRLSDLIMRVEIRIGMLCILMKLLLLSRKRAKKNCNSVFDVSRIQSMQTFAQNLKNVKRHFR